MSDAQMEAKLHDCRHAFSDVLLELGEEDERIVVVNNDSVGSSNTGPFRKQWGTVQRSILRLAFPGGGPRKKPGPYVVPAEEKERAKRSTERVPAFP